MDNHKPRAPAVPYVRTSPPPQYGDKLPIGTRVRFVPAFIDRHKSDDGAWGESEKAWRGEVVAPVEYDVENHDRHLATVLWDGHPGVMNFHWHAIERD